MPTTTTRIPGTYTRTDFSYPSGSSSTNTWTVPNAREHVETRPTLVRTRKPVGWLYPKAYSVSGRSLIKASGVEYLYSSGRVASIFAGTHTFFYYSTSDFDLMPMPPNYESRALTAALLQLKDQRINIGVALGEAASTARTIGGGFKRIQRAANIVGSSLSRVANAARSFKKGRWKKAARQLGVAPPKKVPKDWLELQYGWLPLLSDVHGAIEELNGVQRHELVTTVKASLRKSENYVKRYPNGPRVHKFDVKRSAGFFVRLDYQPANNLVQAATRVGLTNPLEIAWELVPFSFVADWAIPIGDWLSALDADFGWTFLSGSGTVFRRTSVSMSRSHYIDPKYTGNFGGGSHRNWGMDRKVYDSSPTPRFPSFRNPLSLGHAANGFSLIATVFAGRR